jgi:hypothetical protein
MANGWMCGLTLFGLKKLSNLFIYVFNPFIFNKQKRRVISSEGFSALKKNCPSSRVQQTAADYNSCLRFKKSAPNGHYFLQWAATPDQITQKNDLQRAGGL